VTSRPCAHRRGLVEGISFESIMEKIETTSAAVKLVFQVFAASTEFERSVIRERTQAGLVTA
jgi:DNA invertase Pin-like site-specific DNA recombinase